MERQLPAVGGVEGVRAELVGDLIVVPAAPEEDAELAVLRQDPVGRVERRCRPHARRLLPARREVEGDAPLALRIQEDLVKLGNAHHRGHDGEGEVVVELGHVLLGARDHAAQVVHDAKARHHRRRTVDVWVPEAWVGGVLAPRADKLGELVVFTLRFARSREQAAQRGAAVRNGWTPREGRGRAYARKHMRAVKRRRKEGKQVLPAVAGASAFRSLDGARAFSSESSSMSSSLYDDVATLSGRALLA